jgi:hypothetical protein
MSKLGPVGYGLVFGANTVPPRSLRTSSVLVPGRHLARQRSALVVRQDVSNRTSHHAGIVKHALKWSYSFTRLAMR